MKLITLNIWGGRIYEPLLAFLEQHKTNTDIFCFQEVFHNGKLVVGHEDGKSRMNIYSEISERLSEFEGYFAPFGSQEESLATFVKKATPVKNNDYLFVCEADPARQLGIPLQHTKVEVSGHEILICNFHGFWAGPNVGKGDIPQKIEQSKRLIKFLQAESCPKLLCGDFNLWPDTESLAMIEKAGFRNLIKEYGVTSTRSHHYPYENKYADYTMVTPEINVNHFEVLQDVVSDHLPLLIDFQ